MEQIQGAQSQFCVGATAITLTNATELNGATGIWSISDPEIATLSATSGSSVTVEGIKPGRALVYYTVNNGCEKTVQFPIEVLPAGTDTSVIIGIQK